LIVFIKALYLPGSAVDILYSFSHSSLGAKKNNIIRQNRKKNTCFFIFRFITMIKKSTNEAIKTPVAAEVEKVRIKHNINMILKKIDAPSNAIGATPPRNNAK
jgi:hypothetical protein